ncbi:hypothetical protein [Burkholderia oklahomensis]|uniref:hypothetical protein n=1 Tax=Burkholderia oklahomensis TaxID=342113 RepID=UPI000B11DD66|nr:hypothetical protein [Burkholderia oklahomensis]
MKKTLEREIGTLRNRIVKTGVTSKKLRRGIRRDAARARRAALNRWFAAIEPDREEPRTARGRNTAQPA